MCPRCGHRMRVGDMDERWPPLYRRCPRCGQTWLSSEEVRDEGEHFPGMSVPPAYADLSMVRECRTCGALTPPGGVCRECGASQHKA